MSDVIAPENSTTIDQSLVAVMDQYSTVKARSPLFDDVKKTQTQGDALQLSELELRGHMVLRGNSADSKFLQAVEKTFGLPLPVKPLSSSSNELSTILWITPDEWLIITDAQRLFELEVAFRKAYQGHFLLLNQSGGQTLFELKGTNAISVLMKSTPLDIHPREFPIGKVATSLLGKSSATFYKKADDTWHIVVRRSFSDYIWRWLLDAGREFGLGK